MGSMRRMGFVLVAATLGFASACPALALTIELPAETGKLKSGRRLRPREPANA